MLEWIFPKLSKRQVQREEIKAEAESEMRDLRDKSKELDRVIEAVLRKHVEGKSQ